ncbi:HlyD family efflux transporter periplasmic adaptor subunit [Nodosilinea sp. LEGE 07088]|uniref:HlyD family efflux transporter periplasmic adaptor subunit n=1 Tax=Nodosilinea sp. LEGE 07088 TaxID=2777968 RepID=UPI00187F3BBD|nr:HlyD family efflux transporter periplasmic adaptor subunit [Nodosilinea sp. LEGE 07088]MBE9137330.1 HlyD family efflux transporter periplasmic adaptor subunit [Nodosilinea sp. LEGE 07088]
MVPINGTSPHSSSEQNGDAVLANQPSRQQAQFDKPVILRQSPRWSRAVVWTLLGVTTFTIGWACLAKFEEAIPAQGKLEPKGMVQPVQAPVGGVVEQVLVVEGQTVEAGDPLLRFDPETTQAQLNSQQAIRTKLQQENAYYQAQLADQTEIAAPVDIDPGLIQLTSNRAALVAENALYRAQLAGDTTGSSLPAAQRDRLRAATAELDSRLSIANLEVDQLRRQLTQTQAQLTNARDALRVNRDILNRIKPLFEAGGIGEIQYLQQEQEVNNRQTEVNRLIEEEQRLDLQIAQAQEQFRNTSIASQDELQQRIATNDNQIATIDSQLTKTMLENDKRLEELDSQIAQLQQTLSYQELRAPVGGTVFNLKANQAGYVANSTEPILEIVPTDALVARVFITNRDIGFVREGMAVDVRIDSFPYSEFGDVKGILTQIGSDALPPDQIDPNYRFPAEITLDDQAIAIEGQPVQLQSGMSLSANIKTRPRRVISIFSDLFTRKIDTLKTGG